MIREVDLVSYLPPFIADYKETNIALTAENPEFTLIWEAADQTLKNEFIETADEYGISRFEQILNILPSRDDTLENRRARVQLRWFTMMPYVWRMLTRKLIALCGENNFTITKQFDFYRIALDVQLELLGQVEELERIIKTMLPCNIVINAKNNIFIKAEGVVLAVGGVRAADSYLITNDWKEKKDVEGNIFVGIGVAETQMWMITNDSCENMSVKGTVIQGAAVSDAVSVVITEAFREQYGISGRDSVGTGIVMAERIELN